MSGKQGGKQSGQQLVSKAEYARRNNWDRSYLSKKSVSERLEPATVKDLITGRIMIDVELADHIFKRDTDLSKVRKKDVEGRDTASGGFMDTKAERERIALRKDQLNLAERLGQTLPKDDVYAAAAAAGQMIREHLKSRNKRMAEQAATMTDARAILVMMEESDRQILRLASDDFLRRVQPEGGTPGTTH